MSRTSKGKTEQLAAAAGVDRWVTFICTGQGRGEHARRRLRAVAIVDGVAETLGYGDLMRLADSFATNRAGKPVAKFQLTCMTCHRSPQVSGERMTKLVEFWLAQEPDHQSVVRDISDPVTASIM